MVTRHAGGARPLVERPRIAEQVGLQLDLQAQPAPALEDLGRPSF
jgi:hypothetical protein